MDWAHWFYLHNNDKPRPRKGDIALRLGLTPPEFSKRLDPDRYRPLVSDEEVRLTAEIWNQPAEYVRAMFPRSAHAAAQPTSDRAETAR